MNLTKLDIYLDSLLFRIHKDMQNKDSEFSFNDYLAQERILKEIKAYLKEHKELEKN